MKKDKTDAHLQPVNDKNIEILSLEDLINLVLVCKEVNLEISKKLLSLPIKTTYQQSKTKRIRPNFILGAIIRTILVRKWLYFNEIMPAIGKTSKEIVEYHLQFFQ